MKSRRDTYAAGALMASIRFGANEFDRQRMLTEIAEGKHDREMKDA